MKTLYLNSKEPHHTLRYDGYDVNRCTHWVAYGESYEELWKVLLDNNVKELEDLYEYILLKSGKDKKKVSEFLYGIAYHSDDEFEGYWDIIDNYFFTEDPEDEYEDLVLTTTGKACHNSVTDLSEEKEEE